MVTIKSYDVEVSVYNVECPKASSDKHFPTMVFSHSNFTGKVFKCTTCGQQTAIDVRIKY